MEVSILPISGRRSITFMHERLVYDGNRGGFYPAETATLVDQDAGSPLAPAMSKPPTGLSSQQTGNIQEAVGPNSVPVVVPSFLVLLRDELQRPFYLYALMCYTTFYYWAYWRVGLAFTIVIVVSGAVNMKTRHAAQANLHALTHLVVKVEVLRDSVWKTVDGEELVPGDVVRPPPDGATVPCDIVLVRGEMLIDESTLTGEAVPCPKYGVERELRSETKLGVTGSMKKHVLFAGHHCVVGGSGWHCGGDGHRAAHPHAARSSPASSSRGAWRLSLTTTWCSSTPACLSTPCWRLGWPSTSSPTSTPSLRRGCTGWPTVTQVLSPMIPAMLRLGQEIGAQRLRRGDPCVVTIDSQRLAVAGKARVVCFDKTGTLTKSGLEYNSIIDAASPTRHEKEHPRGAAGGGARHVPQPARAQRQDGGLVPRARHVCQEPRHHHPRGQ